jgi:hypothetical protein
MRIAAGIVVLSLLAGSGAAAADLGRGRPYYEPAVVQDYGPVRRAPVSYTHCLACPGHRLPWNRLRKVHKAHVPFGGLRPAYVSGLPWGTLTDICLPVRTSRRAVLMRKG